MEIRSLRFLFGGGIGLAAALILADPALGQSTGNSIEAQRSMVTRRELQASLTQIDREVNSPGYSKTLRDARQAEGDAIRQRLTEGDIQVGDKIHMVLLGEPGWSKDYSVTQLRTIILPGGAEVSVAGLLRSELSDSLKTKLSPFFIEPIVTATTSIALTFSGGLGKIGYYDAPATSLLRVVLMEQGGGLSRDAKVEKSQIKRSGKVVLDGPEFAAAIHDGRTLDQLNVQAGDEIIIAEKQPGSGIFSKALMVLGVLGGAASGVYLIKSIF